MKKEKINMCGVSEVELSYKTKISPSDRIIIRRSEDAHEIFKSSWNDNTIDYIEEFKLLLINRKNQALGILQVSKGGLSGTVSDIRVIFQAALKANAHAIIVSHNHPSGDTEPSEADIKLTKKIKEAGQILDIQLLDHLVISSNSYHSMADYGEVL